MSGKIFAGIVIAVVVIGALASFQPLTRCPRCDDIIVITAPSPSPVDTPPQIVLNTTPGALTIPHTPTSSMFDIPENVTYVVIDVGTNIDGDFAPVCSRDPKCFYVAVEPLTGERTVNVTCSPEVAKGYPANATWKQRCIVLTAAVAPKVGWATFRIATSTACSSLSAGGVGCGLATAMIKVPLIPLDNIIDMIPRNLPVKLISLDCQGNDFEAASSLRRHRSRVAGLIAEMQDLSVTSSNSTIDRRWIYHNGHNKNAGHLRACITQRWGWFDTGSTWNTPVVREVNMHFSNPNHSLSECKEGQRCRVPKKLSPWRHPKHTAMRLHFDDGKCPDETF